MNEKLAQLAATQHGLLTVMQVAEAGHEHLLRRRLRTGEWVREQPYVVRPALWTPSFPATLTSVRLSIAAAGASTGWCFSHVTAARLARLKVPASDEVHVLLPMSRRKLQLRDVVRHFTRAPVRAMRVVEDPVSMLGPALLQCAAVLDHEDLLTLVADVVRREKMTLPFILGLCRPGVSGSSALRRAVNELSGEGIDRWMRVLVRRLMSAGLPPPALEVPFRDGSRVRALLDGYYEEAGLALEVDDEETHSSRDAQERDRQRDRWLFKTYGINTVRTTPREIRRRPDRVVDDIRTAYFRGLRRGRA